MTITTTAKLDTDNAYGAAEPPESFWIWPNSG